MATWAENHVSGMMLDREQHFLTGGAEDRNKLDTEAQGAVYYAVGIDDQMIAMHRRDGSDLQEQSPWTGGIQKQNHDIEPGEIVVADRRHSRMDFRNPTKRPGVYGSVNGHTMRSGSKMARSDLKQNPHLEEVARRQVMRNSVLMGIATTRVDTTPGQGYGTMSQGVTVQVAGMMSLYSPLHPMELGKLVEVVPSAPSQTGSHQDANWEARRGTPDTKAPFIPRPLDAQSASRLAEDGIGRYVETLRGESDEDARKRFERIDDEHVREADMDARVTYEVLQAALVNWAVIQSVLSSLPDDLQAQIGVGTFTAVVENLGVTGSEGANKVARRAVAQALFVRHVPGAPSVDATKIVGGLAALQNPNTPAGRLAKAQLAWPRLFGAIFEQHNDLASRTLGRVVQGGQREFKAVR